MSATAYKVVTADLRSPALPWHDNHFYGDPRITYAVGESFDAAGIQAILGYTYIDRRSGSPVTVEVPPPDPPIDIRAASNQWRGIAAFPTLDAFFLERFGAQIPDARYLELSYELDDLLAGPANNIVPGGEALPGQLSLAAVTVVAEVTP